MLLISSLQLTNSDSEQAETRHWLKTALECGHLSKVQKTELQKKYSNLGGNAWKID